MNPFAIKLPLAKERALCKYLRAHGERFKTFALNIEPDPTNEEQIRSRIVFAILTANSTFKQAVDALVYCKACDWAPDRERISAYGMVPAKADYINQLPYDCRTLLKGVDETWNEWRERMHQVRGLGLCKASFACALLTPSTCPFAVIDTHIQQLYLGHDSFKKLGKGTYGVIERSIQRRGRRFGLNGFVSHWATWAYQSNILHNHDVFGAMPGQHS